MSRLAFAVSAILCASYGSAVAGIVVSSNQTRLATHQSVPVTTYIDGDRLKLTLPGMMVIYRADLDRLWAADLNRGVYYEITSESMREFGGLAAELSAAQAQLHDSLSQLPPEQRQALESLLGGIGLPPSGSASRPVFERTSSSKTVAGYSCNLYRKNENGRHEADFCISPASAAGLTSTDLRVLDRLSDFAAPVMSSNLVPHLDDLDWGQMNRAIGYSGIPLDVVAYEAGKPDIEQTVTSIERAPIPADAFDLPSGLTRQDLGALH